MCPGSWCQLLALVGWDTAIDQLENQLDQRRTSWTIQTNAKLNESEIVLLDTELNTRVANPNELCQYKFEPHAFINTCGATVPESLAKIKLVCKQNMGNNKQGNVGNDYVTEYCNRQRAGEQLIHARAHVRWRWPQMLATMKLCSSVGWLK